MGLRSFITITTRSGWSKTRVRGTRIHKDGVVAVTFPAVIISSIIARQAAMTAAISAASTAAAPLSS